MRTAQQDSISNLLSRPAYVPMVSSVGKAVETRHAQHVDEPKAEGAAEKGNRCEWSRNTC